MEYALTAMRRSEQTLYTLVDRGFAALDYVGPSELYPGMGRVTRLKATMILHWDSVSAPLQGWPLYEGEVVEISVARSMRGGSALAFFRKFLGTNQIGSAYTEKANDLLIARRQKHQGMHWRELPGMD